MVKIPIKAINKLSKELEKRDMLIPAGIILDTIVEDRADIPINAILCWLLTHPPSFVR
ncbi:MAG TPA: hypothetical protein VK206_19800 [Anaerolineales bacterium]|nr:hypothetical protein [Anaerolineales bacterium]